MTRKVKLSFTQILNMNVGFFGIQYSFGLQQSAVNPIYDFLGASPHEIPLLNLAGPMTGLIVQPIIGAMSDKTWLGAQKAVLPRRCPTLLTRTFHLSI